MSEKKNRGAGRVLAPGDISLFCSQVCMVLRAAIPLPEGIAAIGENMENESGRGLVRSLQTDLERNGSLSQTLKNAGVFPPYMVSMVHIGEKAGKLDDVMEALSLYYERDDRLRSRVRSAVVYPLILTLMMAAVIAVLVVRVLPIFDDVLRDMGSDMTAVSAAVMRAGTTIGVVALVVILLLAVLLVVLLIIGRTAAGSDGLAVLLARFRPTRRLTDKIDSARFASVLSMMLSSGYDTSEALELIPDIITGRRMLEKIDRCRKAVAGGEPFPRALEQAQMFPGIYGSMVRVGTKTGNLDEVMKSLAQRYSEEADESIGRAVAVIEPAMVAVLSIVIGAILLSIMLPLMGIMSSIG
jgi:Type II secretory pathway, component PulF